MRIEIGWVIEKKSVPLGLGIQCGRLAWVTFTDAIRFARKADAEAMVQCLGITDQATAVEHSWEVK